MKKQLSKRYLIPAAVCVAILAGLTYYYFFMPFIKLTNAEYLISTQSGYSVYIDQDDNYDSLYNKLKPIAREHCLQAFCILARHSDLTKHVHTGRYSITSKMGAYSVFRHFKNGMQDPVHLVIPDVRTMQDMAFNVGKVLMIDSATVAQTLTSEDSCRKWGYDTATIPALFIPNTYDIYWDTSLDNFMKRMQKENKKFWDDSRMAKANKLKLDPIQVATLASIVDEESNNNEEKPMIAGMYYNRLMLRNEEYPNGMPLQADPTIKFALKDFSLRRIYHNMLTIKSPYNTYTNPGLPPGPIRVASIAGIDAVLNMVHHNYLYMCAKPDFSGTHDFAVTYQEHMANAKRYAEALNKRGIK